MKLIGLINYSPLRIVFFPTPFIGIGIMPATPPTADAAIIAAINAGLAAMGMGAIVGGAIGHGQVELGHKSVGGSVGKC